MKSEVKIQMRFADVDRLGHVNNINLMHYYDLGKNDYIDGVIGADVVSFSDEGFIMAATDASYMEQVKPGENIAVRTKLKKLGNKSFTLFQQIVNTDTGHIKSECRTVMVVFDFIGQHSIPIPEKWRNKMEKELQAGEV